MAEPPDATALVIFMPSGRRGRVAEGRPLLEVAQEMGVEIESICGGRLTCGKCRVEIEAGPFEKHGIHSAADHLSPPSEEERLLLDRLDRGGCRLACVARVRGDALVVVPEESRAHKQIIRKSATERVIEIDPAVRQLYVEVDSAELGEHRGDWGRLQAALAEQWRLAGLTIDLLALRRLQMALRRGEWAVTVTLWQEQEVIDVRSGYQEGVYGIAIDIGSTTVVAHVSDLRSGALLATDSMMNPQVSYGEDLMSRLSYAMSHEDGLEKMHRAIVEALNRLAARAARTAGIRARELHEAVVVGNTTMIHILLGIDPVELGGAPFALASRDAVTLKARELDIKLHPGAYLHVLPAQAGHVGADNVAVLLAEAPEELEGVTLVVDIGTNGEIALATPAGLFSCSSPTGPAFEGAQIRHGMRAAPGAIERVRVDPATGHARFRLIGEERWSDAWRIGPDEPTETQPHHLASGICGSGIIEAVAELFLTGLLRPDGRFEPESACERLLWEGRKGAYLLATAAETTTGHPILVTQEDVRNIQLGKAALYAGAKLIMQRAGVATVDRILLAGAFGSYIDPHYAMVLGLIPDCAPDAVHAVGNTAGDGARIALLNRRRRAEAEPLARRVRYVETAVDPDFQEQFVAALHLPHRHDAFPHLAGVLPEVRETRVGRRRRGRRR